MTTVAPGGKASVRIERRGGRTPSTPRDLYTVEGAPRQAQCRPCLCCRREFDSYGPGHRLCPNCRARSAETSPYAL